MYSALFLAVVSFLLALGFTPLVRNRCRRMGWLDKPDSGRKAHPNPVPRTGGVAVIGAYTGSFALLFAAMFNAGSLIRSAAPEWWPLLPAAGLVAGIGLLDDLKGVRAWHKLVAQIGASSIAFVSGVQISTIGGFEFPYWASALLTVIWLVGCSNAFNLIDGVDGLAAGAALFATSTIVVGSLLEENVPLMLATVPLAGALLGFLRYNFNPASIFLGDSGSLTVGYLLGCFALLWGQTSATVLGMTAPLMALAIPLLDTAIAVGRRYIRGQALFSADASHIHHMLLARGLSPRKVALLLYLACGIAATLSLLASVSDGQYKGVIIVLFCAAAWMGVQHLGYLEFGVVGRVISNGAFRRHLAAQTTLHAFESAIEAARTPDECWNATHHAAKEFGFDQVSAVLGGREFFSKLSDSKGGDTVGRPSWTVRIPLSNSEYVNLARLSAAGTALDRVGPFADAVHTALSGRFEEVYTAEAEADVADMSNAEPSRPKKALGAAAGASVSWSRASGGD